MIKNILIIAFLLITFVACEKEENNKLETTFSPSGTWIEKQFVKRSGAWQASPSMDTIEYTFHADHTGERRVKSKFPYQVGRPVGSFYGLPYDTTNINIDRTKLSFDWEYSLKEQALSVNFHETKETVKWIITDYSDEIINTKALEGEFNLINPYQINYKIEGFRTVFERKK